MTNSHSQNLNIGNRNVDMFVPVASCLSGNWLVSSVAKLVFFAYGNVYTKTAKKANRRTRACLSVLTSTITLARARMTG